MKHFINRALFCLTVSLLASSCMLGGGEVRYRLIAPELEASSAPAEPTGVGTLAVSRPQTDRTRDSSRILLRRDRTLLPWAGVAWIDRAPDLVQTMLIEYLDGRVATVGGYGSLPADYRLDVVMHGFEFAEAAQGLRAEFDIAVRLFDAGGGLVATNRVVRHASADGESIDRALPALESSLRLAFEELSDWLQAQMGETAVSAGADQ